MSEVEQDEVPEGTFVKDLPYVKRGPGGREGRSYDWAAIAERCRQQPGDWLVAFHNIPRSHAHAIKTGQKKEFPNGSEEWLVTTTGKRNQPGTLFIAWVGTPGARRKALAAARGRSLTRRTSS